MNLTEWKQLMNLSGTAISIDDIPSEIDVAPVRHGYWIRKEWAEESEGLLIDNYECSACKGWVRNETNYCPNCGAKMDVERKEE